MNLLLSVDRSTHLPSPTDDEIRSWVSHALAQTERLSDDIPELSVRITDNDEAAHFNQTYRAQSGPTNVLSFAADLPPEADCGLLGDLVICAPLVQKEAAQQQKSEQAHWAHLVIHGVLHLLGHDHQIPAEAAQMELLEIDLLSRLGFPNPYETEQPPEGVRS
ncbi:MAG: rRNA maturation RNase YbeY [Halieaceae bacterium]|nr:rRNA maturation RNase YbeY [Halieaceae bacterium]MDG1932528.1 rRNA maturation RNase YbeY [Luminiphilus sp.]MDG2038365.1 rRNA maturation RNase YbeY [Luminiphilus sp.]RZO81610.1 MAG: rRNA maturation RNase YbeY [Halieaceae bacterium]